MSKALEAEIKALREEIVRLRSEIAARPVYAPPVYVTPRPYQPYQPYVTTLWPQVTCGQTTSAAPETYLVNA